MCKTNVILLRALHSTSLKTERKQLLETTMVNNYYDVMWQKSNSCITEKNKYSSRGRDYPHYNLDSIHIDGNANGTRFNPLRSRPHQHQYLLVRKKRVPRVHVITTNRFAIPQQVPLVND